MRCSQSLWASVVVVVVVFVFVFVLVLVLVLVDVFVVVAAIVASSEIYQRDPHVEVGAHTQGAVHTHALEGLVVSDLSTMHHGLGSDGSIED